MAYPDAQRDVDYSEVIDVRAPCEYAEDHISGALNLPVLDNSQRVEVGTVYKQDSTFKARQMGAAMVSRNIAEHIDSHFSGKDRDYRPLVYCWRGGQRSGSLATVLSDIGWHVCVIEGGYRTYRRHVIEQIDALAPELRFIVLNGYTGSGKTLMLHALREHGEQILDLEGLANHKGSVFGGDSEHPQPAQKRFESLIYDQLNGFDPKRPIYIEAESAKIGKLNLPTPLWQRMKESTVIELDSPVEARARYLTRDYSDWLGDLDRIHSTIDRLQSFHPTPLLQKWKDMAQSSQWDDLATSLLVEHYDQRYRPASGASSFQPARAIVQVQAHDATSLQESMRELLTCAV